MFMGYYCNTVPVNAQKASKGQGDAVAHISATALASITVVLPFIPEQTAIAAHPHRYGHRDHRIGAEAGQEPAAEAGDDAGAVNREDTAG